MPVMSANLYKALIEANVSAESAQRAAEEVANYDDRLFKIDRDLAVLKWMVGTVLALVLAMATRMFLAGHV